MCKYFQWHCEAAALPYRCGGSAGIDFLGRNIAPASRFIRHEDSCADTTNGAQYNKKLKEKQKWQHMLNMRCHFSCKTTVF